MKCRVCKGPAVIDLPRHNVNFCGEHLRKFCRDQVAKAIKDFDMLQPTDRLLVAVSGGKDSLAVWDILLDLGYQADGLYLGLGIGEYSGDSSTYAVAYAATRNLNLRIIDLPTDHGFDIPTAAAAVRKVPCSACGMSKRHLFDSAALEGGYDAVVTGHNLDDEAAVLFGNVLRWDIDYLSRQRPVLEASDGFPRKVKPLVRLSEREMAAYCLVSGIDYQVDECPMAVGNRHIGYKEALNTIELQSPGSKGVFYAAFQDRIAPLLEAAGPRADLVRCTECGAPTNAPDNPDAGPPICGFCRLSVKARAHAPVPVSAPRRRRR